MVFVPGGRARLGSPENEPGRTPGERPPGELELKPFWMSKEEVTWEAFEKYFGNRKATKVDGVTRPSQPYEPPNGNMGTGNHPAVGMRWHGAMGYCEWLSSLTGQRFRLPTEAEWEYAARAGSTGAAPAHLEETAWYKANSQDHTHPVGKKDPNAWGFSDLLGNVWEYCLEPYAPPDYGPVLRGGGWNSSAAELRYAARQPVHPDWYDRDPNRPRSMWWLTDGPFVGFRLVRFIDPAGAKEAARAAEKVVISEIKMGQAANSVIRVTGKVKNGGERALEELELMVYHVTPKGKPFLEDGKGRPTFSKCYPVLVNSSWPGAHRSPLIPGQTRGFEVDLPQPYDYEGDLDQAGARVSALQLSAP
jgi:hypothetical protein